MKNVAQIRTLILSALRRFHGEPAPESTLLATLATAHSITQSEALAFVRDMEIDGYISGTTDELTSTRYWALTTKGQIKANQS